MNTVNRTARLLLVLALVLGAGAAAAQIHDAPILADGPAERIGDPLCEQDTGFLCTPGDNRGRLAVSGSLGWEENGEYYCATEWASVLEFDLSELPVGAVVSATLSLHAMPGHDTAPVVGLFPYAPAAGGVWLERADLTPATALAVFTPPLDWETFSVDVTAGVRDALDAGWPQLGLLVAGAESLAGQDNPGFLFAGILSEEFGLPIPTLSVEIDETVASEARAWGHVKALY